MPKTKVMIDGAWWGVGYPQCQGCENFALPSGNCLFAGDGCEYPEYAYRYPFAFITDTELSEPSTITISHAGDASVGIFGDTATLDICLQGSDIDFLREKLKELFSSLWDFPVKVQFPGEE